MIYELYIISSGGLALYHKPFAASVIDEHLLSGFLTAISDFSKETMGEKLSKIDVKSEQLVVHFDRTMGITLAALSSQKDNPELIRRILMELAEEFYLKFKAKFADMDKGVNVSKVQEAFDPIAERIIESRIQKRSLLRDFLALNLGGLILIIFSFIMANFLEGVLGNYFSAPSPFILANIIAFVLVTVRMQFFLLIGLVPAALVIGYVSGRAKRKQSIGLTLILVGTFFTMNLLLFFISRIFGRAILTTNLLIVVLVIACYLPLYLLTCFFFIYTGGLFKERRYLYPVPPEKLHSFKRSFKTQWAEN